MSAVEREQRLLAALDAAVEVLFDAEHGLLEPGDIDRVLVLLEEAREGVDGWTACEGCATVSVPVVEGVAAYLCDDCEALEDEEGL